MKARLILTEREPRQLGNSKRNIYLTSFLQGGLFEDKGEDGFWEYVRESWELGNFISLIDPDK